MARKRRSYRRGYKAGRRSYRKKGLLGGIKAMDVGQGLFCAQKLGYTGAIQSAMRGDFIGAVERDIIPPMTDTGNMLNLGFGNILIGFNRKILRATGGKFVRRYIA